MQDSLINVFIAAGGSVLALAWLFFGALKTRLYNARMPRICSISAKDNWGL